MKVRDDDYPLRADYLLEATLGSEGQLMCGEWEALDVPAQHLSWLLEVDYRASFTLSEPCIETHEAGTRLFTQYLERGQQGRRWLNLSGISRIDDVVLMARHCRVGPKVRLHGFINPSFEAGPLLIIAPHPDDAELAAYGLYRRLAERTWIVTLSAGEQQKRLDRQYLRDLDGDRMSASRRKGWIRAWNSATTPMLAGIPPERLVMLGYFNDTLGQLVEAPELDVPQAALENACADQNGAPRPGDFRYWNRLALPSDSASANRGDCLIGDLAHVLAVVRPATVVVTHPEVDPHKDHIAAALACAAAIRQSGHVPEQVLLYANHLRKVHRFPYGPSHAAATLWPLSQARSELGTWHFYSEVLSSEAQREKAVAMDTMHDLRASNRLEKRFKRWLRERLSGIPYPRYGEHEYFTTHIKVHETFVTITGEAFRRLT